MIALLGSGDVPLVVTRRVAFTPRSVRLKYGPRVTRFIAISNAVRDAMTGAGIDAGRISIVHSGVAPKRGVVPRDWRAELAWPDDVVVCGIVGAMTGEKGMDLLSAIAQSIPQPVRERLRIVLLGGSKTDISEIGGITSHSAGFVEGIDEAVAGIDLLLHPSKTEGLGTAVIDAMALGVPPIAFSVGGLPEVVDNGISGFLVPPGDTRAFAAGIERLVEDPVMRGTMAEAARQKARQFDAARMTEQTEAVYKELISG
jgi:glycosyltransferase involved in cell wall biosynthesis